MHINDPSTTVRVARQWFVWVAFVTACVVTLFVAGTLTGQWPPHPINIAIVAIPLLGTATTYVSWHQAQDRADSHTELAEARTAIVADFRAELVGLARRIEDITQPLPRAIGTTYGGGVWQAGREVGMAEGYELGQDHAPGGSATVLRISDHRR